MTETFPTLVASTALQMFLMTAAAAGMGRDDDASIARMIAQMCGLTLPTWAEQLNRGGLTMQ
ncbi:MAG: hypothetical protein WD873_08530 [Candidatus Hydrogenedentales bacterium]